MKTLDELGPVAEGEVIAEYVGGARDGERHLVPVVVRAGESAATACTPGDERIADSGERYVRRSACGPQRCRIDAVEVWHYDAERPVRRARPADGTDA